MYLLAALGGTFDRFHTGHQTLLSHAFGCADTVIVGITTDDFILEKDLSHLIEPFEKRRQAVLDYAAKLKREHDIQIVPLKDIFGPTLTDQKIDCLVVSPLTEKGAYLINTERTKQSLSQLPIEVCQVELSSDDLAISSTRIRRGEINRAGFVYTQLLDYDITLNLSQKLEVSKPFGKVYQALDTIPDIILKPPIISVGDTATGMSLKHKVPISFGVFDNLEKRQPVSSSIKNMLDGKSIIRARNKPGTVSLDMVHALEKAIQAGVFVEIDGEEDLAVIPLTLLLPLGSTIIYGQPNEGLVLVEVSEEKKEWVRRLLDNQYIFPPLTNPSDLLEP
jgi:pantetheine-phosphate adenylyltransferase